MSPHGIGYKHTWYPHDLSQWWETFTNLFLSNIINHGESDVQWQISIQASHLSIFGISLWKEMDTLSNIMLCHFVY